MPTGKDPSISGTKKGYSGGLHKNESPITTDEWSKDWSSPLNAGNRGMPGPQPSDGALPDPDEGFPNPMGIPNVDMGRGKGGVSKTGKK